MAERRLFDLSYSEGAVEPAKTIAGPEKDGRAVYRDGGDPVAVEATAANN